MNQTTRHERTGLAHGLTVVVLAVSATLLLGWGLQRLLAGSPPSEWLWAMTLGTLVVVLAVDGVARPDVPAVGTVLAGYGEAESTTVLGVAYGATALVGVWSLHQGYQTPRWAALLTIGFAGTLLTTASLTLCSPRRH